MKSNVARPKGRLDVLSLGEDVLLRVAVFVDVNSLNQFVVSNSQLYKMFCASPNLTKFVAEQLYPSVSLIKLENYIPFIRRTPGSDEHKPKAIINSKCFAILLDLFAPQESPDNNKYLFSGLLELNEDSTAYEGVNILPLVRPNGDFTSSGLCSREEEILEWRGRCKIAIIRADGGVLFNPHETGIGEPHLENLFGLHQHTWVTMFDDQYSVQYRYKTMVDSNGILQKLVLKRGFCHRDNEIDFYHDGGHIRNFGADCSHREGWNYECKASIPKTHGRKDLEFVPSEDDIDRESPLVWFSQEVLDGYFVFEEEDEEDEDDPVHPCWTRFIHCFRFIHCNVQ